MKAVRPEGHADPEYRIPHASTVPKAVKTDGSCDWLQRIATSRCRCPSGQAARTRQFMESESIPLAQPAIHAAGSPPSRTRARPQTARGTFPRPSLLRPSSWKAFLVRGFRMSSPCELSSRRRRQGRERRAKALKVSWTLERRLPRLDCQEVRLSMERRAARCWSCRCRYHRQGRSNHRVVLPGLCRCWANPARRQYFLPTGWRRSRAAGMPESH